MNSIAIPQSGAEIRALRERLGMTQDEFARLLDVGQYTVSRWETGFTRPRRVYLTLIRMIALPLVEAMESDTHH